MILNRYIPKKISDKVAKLLSNFFTYIADILFQERYAHRAVVVETTAAVPGMIGGMLIHLKCLRKQSDDYGWVKSLLDEAQNERMHHMIFVEIAKPNFLDRVLIVVFQGMFFLGYLILYIISSKTAHRLTAYLEEEAILSYTRYLENIDSKKIENIAAPKLAIEYWNLSANALLRDVVIAVRNDEMGHLKQNHKLANILSNSTKLKIEDI